MGAKENDTLLTLVAKGASNNVGLVSYSVPEWDPLHDPRPPPADIVGLSGSDSAGTGDPRRFTDDFAEIWPDMTGFLVSLYWTILADLGQQNSNNVLIKSDALTTLSAPLGDASFARSKSGKDILIRPSTIFTSYLCQTVQLKPPLSLIFSVLVADLVLLSSGWTVLTLTAAWLAKKRDHDGMNNGALLLIIANYCPCASCAAATIHKNYQELSSERGFKHNGRQVESLQISEG